jgi:hypothetical protein
MYCFSFGLANSWVTVDCGLYRLGVVLVGHVVPSFRLIRSSVCRQVDRTTGLPTRLRLGYARLAALRPAVVIAPALFNSLRALRLALAASQSLRDSPDRLNLRSVSPP